MRESRPGSDQGSGQKPALEGRQYDKDGKDIGDAAFHEIGWGFTPDKEQAALEANAAQIVELEIRQVEEIAVSDPELGAKAFDQLLTKHPDDPRVEGWRAAVKKLAAKNSETDKKSAP